jgi:hypothetical protein
MAPGAQDHAHDDRPCVFCDKDKNNGNKSHHYKHHAQGFVKGEVEPANGACTYGHKRREEYDNRADRVISPEPTRFAVSIECFYEVGKVCISLRYIIEGVELRHCVSPKVLWLMVLYKKIFCVSICTWTLWHKVPVVHSY